MDFHTLENVAFSEILATFNLAFSDYSIPLQLTEAQLAAKMKSDNTDFSFSAGAFEEGKLIGIILHGYAEISGEKWFYNGGTGVIPAKRGQKITSQLYDFLLPKLKEKNAQKVVLEVINTNKAAIATYQKLGFVISRTLNCYKGELHLKATKTPYKVEKLRHYNWTEMQSFWDFQPSWQNSIPSVENLKENLSAYGIYDGNLLLAYIIVNEQTSRISQFAVRKTHRNQGLGRQLFEYVSQLTQNQFVLINIDENASESNSFLASLGFQVFLQQYEMELKIS